MGKKKSLRPIKRSRKKDKKRGAIELSMSTIVVLVMAMLMLTLGLVLVRSIFRVATSSVNQIDDKVKSELTSLFTDEGKKIVVKLGADKKASIQAGTSDFGVAFGAKSMSGGAATKDMKYKLSLDDASRENCYKTLGKSAVTKLFKQNLDTFLQFDEFEGDAAFSTIQLTVPEATKLCTQKVYIDVKDGDTVVGRSSFTIEVIQKGFFG